MRRMVVLPEPDGPSSVRNSPSRMSRSIPSTAVTGPKRLEIPRHRTATSPCGSLMRRLPPAPAAADRRAAQHPKYRTRSASSITLDIEYKGGCELLLIRRPAGVGAAEADALHGDGQVAEVDRPTGWTGGRRDTGGTRP